MSKSALSWVLVGWFSALCMCQSRDGSSGVGMIILLRLFLPSSGGGCTTRQPFWSIVAIEQYLRISEQICPDFFEGCFPVLRWLAAVLQAALEFWAAAHDLGL